MNKYFKLFEQHRLYDRLPSGFKIVKYDKEYRYTDDTYVCIYITDSEYNILSSIEAVSIEDNYYVGGSASKLRGLGALAYEFTMMSIYPSGLMPNRDGDVREKAFNVWEKFYERNDLEKESIAFSSSQYSIAIATGEDEPTTEEENREFYEESDAEYQKTLDTFNTAYKIKPNSIYESNIINLDSLPIEIQDKIKEEEKMFFGNLYENMNSINESKELNSLIKNARKWDKDNFIEEYVYLNNITTNSIIDRVNTGDTINLVKELKDDKGNTLRDENGKRKVVPYKEVTATKDYSSAWDFILDNTKELQEEAIKLYDLNKSNKKGKIESDTIEAYHASPNKFDMFKYGQGKTSAQLGADTGFFFFLDKKVAEYYASVIKDNNGESYIYTVGVKSDNIKELKGEDVGTNWNRVAELDEADGEGYDAVIIKDADTGYGITDEMVVFDDDNIQIKNIEQK